MLVKHSFLTESILEDFRTIWDQSETSNPIVVCKYFDPCSHWTRYATEYDEETKIFFGFVRGIEQERWSFSLAELQGYKWTLGIGIERDIHFEKCTFSEMKEKEGL